MFSCFVLFPAHDVPAFLAVDQTGQYAQVTFSGASYGAALVEVSDLGLRLADPCLERAYLHWWQPVGQEASFATSETLTVATTRMASTDWQHQVVEQPFVVHSQVLNTLAC